MRIQILFLFFLFFRMDFSYSQMQPADSLLGEYVGLWYYKSAPTNPWTITSDTEYVSNIDSINCKVNLYASTNSGQSIYYTDYYSCNGTAPANFYVKFYSGDSLRLINDNEPQPPPNPAISYRFFGKRISNKITAENEVINAKQIKVYPNPVSEKVFIDIKNKAEITLFDVYGREILKTQQKELNVSNLPNGVYFIRVTAKQAIASKKIIVRH